MKDLVLDTKIENKTRFYEALSLIGKIEDKIKLEDYMRNEFNVDFRHGGTKNGSPILMCNCPIHEEKTPSFALYSHNQTFYCFGCLEENELIWTDGGLKPIKDIETTDKVIDLYGKWQNIKNKTLKSRMLLEIKTDSFQDPICLSPDHHCLFLSIDQILNKLYQEINSDSVEKYDLVIKENVAANLRENDFFLIPIISTSDRINNDLIYDFVSDNEKLGGNINTLPAGRLPAKLYGLWLSSGTSNDRDLIFSFQCKERKKLAKFTKIAIKKIFNVDSLVYNIKSENVSRVICKNSDLCKLFSYFFGNEEKNKKIPADILFWNNRIQKELINGYYWSCGNEAHTTSKNLAYGIYMLGIQSKQIIHLLYNKISSGDSCQESWCNYKKEQKDSTDIFKNINGTEYFITRISSIESIKNKYYNVYDIEVENTHTFLTKNCITHNCHEHGGLIRFAQKVNKWGWFQTIYYFAQKLNLSCTFNEEDVINMMEDMYNRTFVDRIDEFNPLNVNYYVSTECKKIFDKYGSVHNIDQIIENIYRITDKAIAEKDRAALYRIKEEIMPAFLENVKSFDKKESEIKALNINNLNCTRCFLRHQAHEVVIGEGNMYSPVMIIGEAPGKDEDLQGRPFVGPSGKLLRDTLYQIGFSESDVWIDNVSNCRPPDNRFQPKEAMLCKKMWLNKRIGIIKPKAIMLMGNNASQTFLEDTKFAISNYINKKIEVDVDGTKLIAHFNYHPSFVIRKGGAKEDNESYIIFKKTLQTFMETYIKK